MSDPRQLSRSQLGRRGEALAVAYLTSKGYRIIQQNYRCPIGEIDIVAIDRGTLCFVEVKTRSNPEYQQPQTAVHDRKQSQLSRVAMWYLKEKGLKDAKARFDVVAITRGLGLHDVQHFKNAFDVACLPKQAF